jgi:hypothetical protein
LVSWFLCGLLLFLYVCSIGISLQLFFNCHLTVWSKWFLFRSILWILRFGMPSTQLYLEAYMARFAVLERLVKIALLYRSYLYLNFWLYAYVQVCAANYFLIMKARIVWYPFKAYWWDLISNRLFGTNSLLQLNSIIVFDLISIDK